MTFKIVNKENIDQEHICCAITEKKGENCVASKKAWLKDRFEDGLVFYKLDVRGKVFIEYIPSEKAFVPIIADDYFYINCLWVSGKYKGQGYADKLLNYCIEDAKSKGKKGLMALGSKKKMHFLSDPKYLKHKGFEVCDRLDSGFELLYLPFDTSDKPKFNSTVKTPLKFDEEVVIIYSNGCPHTSKYISLDEALLKARGVTYKIIKLETLDQARQAVIPCSNFALIVNNKFISSEVLSEKRLNKYLDLHLK